MYKYALLNVAQAVNTNRKDRKKMVMVYLSHK